jgi:hypothetical protein
MKTLLAMPALATVLLTMALTGAVAQADTTRTVASYPAGTFLKNLAQGSDGSLLVTS